MDAIDGANATNVRPMSWSLLFQDPFFLEKTIICCDQDWEQEYFEIHEFGSKDSYIFKVGILCFSYLLNPCVFRELLTSKIIIFYCPQ